MQDLEDHASPIERFQAAVKAGSFVPENGVSANIYQRLISSVVGVEDETLFAEWTGIPMPIMLTFGPVLQDLPEDEAIEAASDWLRAAAGGLDDTAAEHVVVQILDHDVTVARLCGDRDAQDIHADLLALHRAASVGTPPSNGEWRAMRKKAVGLVSGRAGDDRVLVAALATGAWPVASAPELLHDLLIDENRAQAIEIARGLGVTLPVDADWDAFRDVIDGEKAAGKTKAEAFASIDDVLAKRFPELRARLKINDIVLPRAQKAAARAMAAALGRGLVAAGRRQQRPDHAGLTAAVQQP